MRLGTIARAASFALAVAAASCSSSSSSSTSSTSVTQTIGPEGGTIVVDGATVTFPKGALAEAKSITIKSGGAVPDGFVAVSKVFECGPTGTDFAQPVTMQMPFEDDGKGGLTMFWSSGADPSFKDIGGKPDGKTMTATVMHFSSGFVGRKK
jgi:hypothetical protein